MCCSAFDCNTFSSLITPGLELESFGLGEKTFLCHQLPASILIRVAICARDLEQYLGLYLLSADPLSLRLSLTREIVTANIPSAVERNVSVLHSCLINCSEWN